MSVNNKYPTFQAKWTALVTRDPEAAHAFFECVKSTRIFCRPTCAARLSRRKNVVFYDSAEEALAHGFRPCKRCKPLQPVHDEYYAIIRSTCRALDNSPGQAPPLKDLAESAGLTQWHFHRMFKRFTGITPKMYWEARHKPGKRMALQKKMRGGVDLNGLIESIRDMDENTVLEWVSERKLRPKKTLEPETDQAAAREDPAQKETEPPFVSFDLVVDPLPQHQHQQLVPIPDGFASFEEQFYAANASNSGPSHANNVSTTANGNFQYMGEDFGPYAHSAPGMYSDDLNEILFV